MNLENVLINLTSVGKSYEEYKNVLSIKSGKNLATVTPQSFGVKIRGTLVFLCPKERDRERARKREREREIERSRARARARARARKGKRQGKGKEKGKEKGTFFD